VADKPDYHDLKGDVIDWLMKNQEVWFNQPDTDRIERALNQAYAVAKQMEKRRAYLAMPSTSEEDAEVRCLDLWLTEAFGLIKIRQLTCSFKIYV
jgi:hypothetical protein